VTARLRLLLGIVLVAAFVGGGSSAAWALWTASGTTSSSITVGRVAATLSGADALTTSFSSTVTTSTKPLTFTNTGTVAATTSTVVSVASGSSSALAQTVDVRAWPVASTASCITSTAVGTGAVSGTWASLPSMSSQLKAGGSAVWCVRSTPRTSAPTAARSDVTLDLTVSAGTWTSSAVRGAFSITTPAPALVCTDHSGYYVEVAWDGAGRPMDTWYASFVKGVQVGDRQQMYFGRITLAPSQIPASVATSGTITVDVHVLDAAGAPTAAVAGSGPLTLFTQNDGPALRCGA
jgi:hypothetical protein